MCKKGLITFYSNIVTLQSKNKNKAFKAEVKFTKLKMKINKIKSTELLGNFDYPITVTLQLVYHKHTYTCRIQILNVTTTKFQRNARGGTRPLKSVNIYI